MIIPDSNTPENNTKIFKIQPKQRNFFAYKTQNNFRTTLRDFNNIYSSPTSKQSKIKNHLISFGKQAKNAFLSFQQKQTINSRLSRRSKDQIEQSKNIFRQTFSIPKSYQTQNINKNIRPPTGINQNYRPATRIRKINNIGEESNSNFLIKYQIIKQLGKGMYGTVHLARLKQKYIKDKKLNESANIKDLQSGSKSLLFQHKQINEEFQSSQCRRYMQNNNMITIQLAQTQNNSPGKDENNQQNNSEEYLECKRQTKQNLLQNEQNLVAIKVYEKFKMNKDPSKFKNIRREINIMQNLKHEGIIKLHQSVQSLTKISLVVQYGGEISLLDYLKKNYPLSQSKVKLFAKQLLEVIIYLHQKNIVHRDIKLQNILVKKSQDSQQIKLIDFGFSTLTNKDRKLNVICGTPNFMAPQLLNSKQYIGQKADVWSYGVVIYTLAQGRLPFKTDSYQQLQALANKGKITFKKNHNKSFINFIRSVLKVKTQQRPRAIEIQKFQWMQQCIS